MVANKANVVTTWVHRTKRHGLHWLDAHIGVARNQCWMRRVRSTSTRWHGADKIWGMGLRPYKTVKRMFTVVSLVSGMLFSGTSVWQCDCKDSCRSEHLHSGVQCMRKGWLALWTLQLFAAMQLQGLQHVRTHIAVIRAGWHSGPCSSLRRFDCKDSSPS